MPVVPVEPDIAPAVAPPPLPTCSDPIALPFRSVLPPCAEAKVVVATTIVATRQAVRSLIMVFSKVCRSIV
jgi:hypothetical protein